MARLFDDASSQYLYVDSTPITGAPLTLACWFYNDEDGLPEFLLGIHDKDVNNEALMIEVHGDYQTPPSVAVTSLSAADGWNQAYNTEGATINAWHFAAGVFASTTSRKIYLDDDSPVEDTNFNSPINLDSIGIGAKYCSSITGYMSGGIAEPAMWNIALTGEETLMLAAGFSPLMVRPQNLVFYMPAVRDNDEDIIGGLSLTAVNSPTIADHPPIIYPAPPIFYSIPAAVADERLTPNILQPKRNIQIPIRQLNL